MDKLNEFITNPQDCESIYIEALKRGNKDLVEQNTRLQAELDKTIHKLSDYEKALKEYADEENWENRGCSGGYINVVMGVYKNCEPDEMGFELAQETLKKWENK